jgi:hypothetical protein
MDWWLPCKFLLYSYKRRRAVAALRLWFAPGVGTRQVMLLRDGVGNVFQVAGDVGRVGARDGYYRIELQVPWETALSLAALAKRAVAEGGRTVLYGYVGRIKDASLPPLKLVYEGLVALRGTLIHKVLDAPAGYYFLELRLGGVPVFVLSKYYKYLRKDIRAGGDSGAFSIPLDVLYTFYEWGLHELGANYDYVYARVWMPSLSAAQQVKLAKASF